MNSAHVASATVPTLLPGFHLAPPPEFAMLDALADLAAAAPALRLPPLVRRTASRADTVPAPLAGVPSAGALVAVLDEIDYPVLVVELPAGRVRHANRQAVAEGQRHGTLEWPDGVAQAGDAVGQRAWLGALAAASQGRRSLVTLRGRPDAAVGDVPEGPASVSVAVVPLPGDEPMQAMAVFGKRQVADALSVGFFSRLHALTPTEDAVLLGLCRGLKPVEIAAAHGVAISTVRTHVNAIRLKTGTCSIRELVHRVSTLPPMAPAVRADES